MKNLIDFLVSLILIPIAIVFGLLSIILAAPIIIIFLIIYLIEDKNEQRRLDSESN